MGWSDDQIKNERKAQESKQITDELRLMDTRAKDAVGKGCFDAVKNYVRAEVEKYNAAQQSPANGIFYLPDSSVEEEGDMLSKIPSFSIFRKDQPRARLYVKYSQPQHALLWRCGSSQGSYQLRVSEDEKGFLLGSDGNPRTPEQVGDELLNRAARAEPTSGTVWA
jgi:hypothetical protein